MDHREISLRFLRSTGLIPVKVRPGQKDPFPEWDPRRVANDDHSLTLKAMENDRKLNVGALFYGKYVDLDIDVSENVRGNLQAALDFFLPKTPYEWGRPKKPRSHRVYALHSDFDRAPYSSLLRFMKSLKIGESSYSVEVRGGRPENGLFTVLPGSYRADDDEYVEWHGDVDPTVGGAYVATHVLLKSVRLAIASAVISEYYGSGVRNDMSLALAGLLWRIRASSMAAAGLDLESDAAEDAFLLTEDDALALFSAITHIADDNKADHHARRLNFKNTWEKLDKDPAAKVTGGNILAELCGTEGEKIIKAMYRLLSDNDGIEQMEALADQFVVWYGQGVLIDMEMVERGRQVSWMNREQATNSLGGRKISLGDKKIPIVNLLFGSTFIKRVQGFTFDPGTLDRMVETDEGTMVNQWRGFETVPCPQMVTDDEVRPFLNYINEVVADKVPQRAEWVLDWVADLLQNPHKKPGTALVLVGPQGAGKTFLGEKVIAAIIGKSHSVQMNSIESLTSKFNVIADNRVFVQCDEAVHSYQKDVAARLKSIITDDTMTVEPKMVNAYKKPNHMHFLFTSNEESTAIFIDPTPYERRFTVLKVAAHRATDVGYWSTLRTWTAANLPKIMRWLLDRKVDRNNVIRPLDTAAKRTIQRVGVDPEIAWIINRVALGFPIAEQHHQHWWQAFNEQEITDQDKKNNVLRRDVWPDQITIPTLEDDFRSFVRVHGRTVYSGSLITNIRRALPEDSMKQGSQPTVTYMDPKSGQQTKTRIRLFGFPSIEDILDNLRAKYGPMVDEMIETAIKDAGLSKPQQIDTTPQSEEY